MSAPATLSFEAIGTSWNIDIFDPVEPEHMDRLETAVLERIADFDQAYSRFRDDSLVAQMSRQAGTYDLPPDAAPMLQHYHDLYRLTGGRVTPLVGSLMVEAGYDSAYSLKPGEMHVPPAWDDVLVHDSGRLTLKSPALLDFGAAGKGYLVDLVGAVLNAAGIQSFIIDAGGDILTRGQQLRIGLEHPGDPSQAIGVVELKSGAIAASATNRRRWAGLHHIMDPLSARPVENIVATWAIAPTALVADGLATALFFTDPEVLATKFAFDYVIMYADQSVRWSRTLPGEIFS